tara:strand:- start:195 stop:509 length:315 start_codon:yes stop_codon:yes gene_type:complete
MQKLKFISLSLVFLFLAPACQTIQKKTDDIVKKENKKLNQYLGITYENLKIEMGKPDMEIVHDDSESPLKLIYYRSKKYGISCERRFELDQTERVIGFVSKGCL